MAIVNCTRRTCPGCGSGGLEVFFRQAGVPTEVNFLFRSRTEAVRCPRGDIELGFCHRCGLISNTAFDEKLLGYREGYENSLHFSAVFQEYAEKLSSELVERFDLHDRDIVEIGCGRGDFLVMLCEKGGNRGVGFDPSHTGDPAAASPRVRFVRDFYSEKYASHAADFICSRHTLEHVPRPATMLEPLRASIGARKAAVFFEVPNALFTLRELYVWDIIYEHTSYFTPGALRWTFERAGFEVRRVYESFGGQYLCCEAYANGRRSASGEVADVEATAAEIRRFGTRCRDYVAGWERRIRDLHRKGRRVVLWGGGSKGVTFLNTFREPRLVEYVVDVNPRKHGMFIAGTGQEIVPPDFLRNHSVDVALVANPLYAGEIAGIARSMGAQPELLSLQKS